MRMGTEWESMRAGCMEFEGYRAFRKDKNRQNNAYNVFNLWFSTGYVMLSGFTDLSFWLCQA